MDLNKVMLIGNVGGDPTYHQMGSEKNLAKFSVATSRKWKDKKSGEQREDTAWHNIVVFNPYLVKVVEDWIIKGTRVYIEGEIKTRSYDKDGEKKYITEIIISIKGEIMIVARGKGWRDDRTPADAGTRSGAGGPRPASESMPPMRPQPDDYDDDIPF